MVSEPFCSQSEHQPSQPETCLEGQGCFFQMLVCISFTPSFMALRPGASVLPQGPVMGHDSGLVLQVGASLRPVVTSMRALYDTCAAASVSNPRTKREMDNNSTRLGYLFWQLNEGTAAPLLCAVQITCSCTCCQPCVHALTMFSMPAAG